MNIWHTIVQAAKVDDLETVETLISNYPELRDNDRALVTASRFGHRDIVTFLLGDDPPFEAAYKALEAAVSPHRRSPEKSEQHAWLAGSLLKLVSETRRVGTARRLVDAAARSGSRLVLEVLLEHTDADFCTAAAQGDVDTVQEWIKENRRIVRYGDASGKTALHYCSASAIGRTDQRVAQGLVTVAQLLLEWGADVNARCRPERSAPFGLSPLECAVLYGENVELVSVLVNHGAQELDQALRSVLVHRSDPGKAQYEIAEVLMASGASIDRPFNGRTILHDLAHHGSSEGIQWVLAHGSDVNARARDGRTALHFASDRDDGEAIVKALLEAKADTKLEDEEGHLPIWFADRGERQNVLDLLRAADGR